MPAPDQLTGAQFPIQLRTTKAVELDDVHVMQNDASDLSTTAVARASFGRKGSP